MEQDKGQSYGTSEPRTHLWFYVALVVIALALAAGTHVLARREIAALRQEVNARISDVQASVPTLPDPALTLDLADAKSAIAALRAELATRPTAKDIADLVASNKAMTERIDALQVALNGKAADMTSTIVATTAAIDALRADVAGRATAKDVADLSARTKSTVDALRTDVETRAKAQDVATIATGLKTNADRLDTLQVGLDGKASTSDLAAGTEAVKGAFEKVKEGFAKIRDALAKLEADAVTRAKADALADLTARFNATAEQVAALQSSLSDKASTSDVSAQIAPITAALTDVKARLDALSTGSETPSAAQPQKAP